MADKVEIEVLIAADGTVTLTTHGLKGTSCIEETQALEKALGQVIERRKTAEYYAATATGRTSVKGK